MSDLAAEYVEDFSEFLRAKRTQLWSGPGNLADEGERRQAAEWFLSEWEKFVDFLTARQREEAEAERRLRVRDDIAGRPRPRPSRQRPPRLVWRVGVPSSP